jgi:hypothetical protein
LEKICLEYDKCILAALPTAGLKAYGLCELIKKSDQQEPVTVDIKRKPAAFIDSMNGHYYWRFIGGTEAEDEEMSFGIDIADRISPRMRIFIAHKIQLGEEFIFEFVKTIPKKLALDGYKFIHRSSSIDLITDHEGVYNQEYNDKTAYERHRTTHNIYAIEFNLEFIKC